MITANNAIRLFYFSVFRAIDVLINLSVIEQG